MNRSTHPSSVISHPSSLSDTTDDSCPPTTAAVAAMQTYTLCDLDNNQTRCYPDCRYESSPFDHTHHYVTSASSPVDENPTVTGYENTVVDDEFLQLGETDRVVAISPSGHYPLDVTYYFRCSDYENASEYCYGDDPLSVENAGSWTYENWKYGCRTFCADNLCFTRSWDDIILDSGYGPGYPPMYDGTDVKYMEMLPVGRKQPTWNDSVVVSEDDQRTRSQYAAATGNENRLMRGIETFKWMTVRRGSSKYVQTGLLTVVLYSILTYRH